MGVTMDYTFEIIAISPILDFFNCQQQIQQKQPAGAEYLGSYHCTLDSFIATIETVPPQRGWHLDRVIDTVIDFWLNNAEQVSHWKRRLEDAGSENLLVARVADLKALRAEFEFLFAGDR
jgi:plasmid maintenance system antidote protein VapI